MADVIIHGSLFPFTNDTDQLATFTTGPLTAYVIFQDSSGDLLEVWKTADGGATWAEQDHAGQPAGTFPHAFSAYFDQETKDNNGTLIHMAWAHPVDNAFYYVTFDTATDTWGTRRTVDSLTVSSTEEDSDCSIAVGANDKVYVLCRGDRTADVEDTDHSFRSSTDNFVSNNESEKSPYTSNEEKFKLIAGQAADANDMAAVGFDFINQDLDFWKFDASLNTWSSTSIDDGLVWPGSTGLFYKSWDVTTRFSDGKSLLIYRTERDSATGDMKSFEIDHATPTITEKADLSTNKDDQWMVAILINQQNGKVYVAYIGADSGAEAIGSTAKVYYKVSDDSMDSWGTEQAYSTILDDIKGLALGHSIGDPGGLMMPVYFNDDLNDCGVNADNTISIASADVPAPAHPVNAYGYRRHSFHR